MSIFRDVIIAELTGGNVKKWPAKGGLRASALTHKYSILHKIGLKNWVPTSNHSKVAQELAEFLYRVGTKSPLNFGQMVFDHVCSHTRTFAYKKPLGYPSLIFGIIQNQEDVVTPEDVYEPAAPDVVITAKLQNADYHINDLVELSDDDDEPLTPPTKKKKVNTVDGKKNGVYVTPSLKHKSFDESVFFPLSIGRDFLVDLIAESEFHTKSIHRTERLIKIFGDSLDQSQ